MRSCDAAGPSAQNCSGDVPPRPLRNTELELWEGADHCYTTWVHQTGWGRCRQPALAQTLSSALLRLGAASRVCHQEV